MHVWPIGLPPRPHRGAALRVASSPAQAAWPSYFNFDFPPLLIPLPLGLSVVVLVIMVSVSVTDSRSWPTSSVFRIRITTNATRKISTTTVMMSVNDGHTLSSSDRPLTVGETRRSTKPSVREIATDRYRFGSFSRKPSRSTWVISIRPSLLRCISSR